ncbi:MAG: aromatic ring-hydroxylating dioxygenase subunit alpha [Betaproteobacteria bacterium]|nr:aromatic ring-hydroxylating dioxygenase subunit alpha [Betaproteobacteria bacterium]
MKAKSRKPRGGKSSGGKYQDRLVDAVSGRVQREIFVNEDIYQEELEKVFGRAWLFVGHESQIPQKGDFFSSRMGEEAVVMCRDDTGKIRVLLNSCRHRGMKICRYDEGNAKDFVCSYHAWAYRLDGTLYSVPLLKEAYQNKLDMAGLGLVQAAQVFNYKGTIWATWDGNAPGFLDYLGEYRLYFDLTLDAWDGTEGETEVLGGVQKWKIPCNWKFHAENFCGDRYHATISHASVNLAGTRPGMKGRRDTEERTISRYMQACFPEFGHTGGVYILPRDVETPLSYQDSPVVSEYFRECEARKREKRGDLGRLIGSPGEIFPNTGLIPRQPRAIAVCHPSGVHQTEAWRWFLVDKKAPQEVKNYMIDFYVRYSGPAGMTEQDDMENWNYAHAASRGVIARQHAYNYSQGLGRGIRNPEYDGLTLPGVVVDLDQDQSSEQNMRGFYGRWADYMDADDWSALVVDPKDLPRTR